MYLEYIFYEHKYVFGLDTTFFSRFHTVFVTMVIAYYLSLQLVSGRLQCAYSLLFRSQHILAYPHATISSYCILLITYFVFVIFISIITIGLGF